MRSQVEFRTVSIPAGGGSINGDLNLCLDSRSLVLFAHGSGSSRHSPRNKYVAQALNRGGFSTLLLDLLTGSEESRDQRSAQLRFNIGLLSGRLVAATDWLRMHLAEETQHIGYFGASTGAAAALVAAAERPKLIEAIVSRGGRPDLAGSSLSAVRAPTLLIVGELDDAVIELNRRAAIELRALHKLKIIPGATHLFQEPGALEEVAGLARRWFGQHLLNRETGAA
ncbi:MAG TPA: dienelactone hydrolase family protein [Terriglobia bacterium]|jgi:pimeloyl-ACP methyl ester carboxylesterase